MWRPRVTEGREGGRGSANSRDSWELRRQGAARPLRQEEPRSWAGGPRAGREGDTHLQGDDVLPGEGLVGQQVSEVLGLDV